MANKKEKKLEPPLLDYETDIMWSYKDFTKENIALVEEFLKKNAKEIPALLAS